MGEIPADDLKIETWPERSNYGGQHVGFDAGIRVTHIPSNVQACVDIGRSQHINKMIAMDMILSAITHPRFR